MENIQSVYIRNCSFPLTNGVLIVHYQRCYILNEDSGGLSCFQCPNRFRTLCFLWRRSTVPRYISFLFIDVSFCFIFVFVSLVCSVFSTNPILGCMNSNPSCDWTWFWHGPGCDLSFALLLHTVPADYTRLFGRVPFLPNFRIPSIRGGITPQLLSLVAAKSGHPLPTGPSSTSETPHSTGLVGSSTSSGVSTVGLPLPTAFHPSTSTTMNFTGSLESATTSNVGRSPISSISSHRPLFAHRPDPSEYMVRYEVCHFLYVLISRR